MPEEEWTQITFKFQVGETEEEKSITQYNVFERRLADKLSYMDWKLSYVIDMEDFKFIHAKTTDAVNKTTESVQKDIKQQNIA